MSTRFQVIAVAVLLMVTCIAYAIISVTAPETASALGIGFIGFVLLATIALRLLRRI